MFHRIVSKIRSIEIKLDRSIAFLLRIDYSIPIERKPITEKAKVAILKKLTYKHEIEALGTAC